MIRLLFQLACFDFSSRNFHRFHISYFHLELRIPSGQGATAGQGLEVSQASFATSKV